MTIVNQNTQVIWPSYKYNNVEGPNQPLGWQRFYEVTFSHNLRNLGTRSDCGGPWLMERTRSDFHFGKFQGSNPRLGYNGPTLPWRTTGVTAYSIGTAPTDSSYNSDGAKAIAATEPTNPVFDMSTFIGETLQDGLPHMAGASVWKDQTLRAKQAGSEYLNYQFGWLPFVSDLRDFAYAVKHSTEILKNHVDHANIKIRRNLEFFKDYQSKGDDNVYFIDTANNSSIGSARTYTTATRTERKWFAGEYIYYIPLDNSTISRIRRYHALAHKLLGVDLTPDTVWNIAPWSWAADWKTDMGAVVHNISAFGNDSLVLHYGYVMHSLSSVITWDAGKWGRATIATQRLRRVAANPYGFGVSEGGLSVRQLSILAALGVSRRDAKRIR